MKQFKLLDLYCCEGGAGEGYKRAGFDVTGVDINPQPYNPHRFVQSDAISYLVGNWKKFHVVHASPPCRDHTPLTSRVGFVGNGWLLQATIGVLGALEIPWIVENVPGAVMRKDLVLCGGMFGLRTYRHRWFQTSPGLSIPAPFHPKHVAVTSSRKTKKDFAAGMHISVTGDVGSWVGPSVMGIDWMSRKGVVQAVPPCYTEYIGFHLMKYLGSKNKRVKVVLKRG
jgi:DNA (cytosine-5)-methyltransferase 1